MKTRSDVLISSFEGDDVEAMVRLAVAIRPEFKPIPEDVAANIGDEIAPSPSWLDDVLAKFKRSLDIRWRGPRDPTYPLLVALRSKGSASGSVQIHLSVDWTVACVVDHTLSLGAWFAVFDHLYHDSTKIEDSDADLDDDERAKKRNAGWRVRRGIEGGHVDLGWGCLLVGERGHQQLVSRRWLEYGPWWLRRFPGDVSLVQFHDLDADADTALAQGLPGHRRMSDHEIGGYLRRSYRPVSDYKKDVPEFRALYVPSDQSLRVVCAPSRGISQAEMLDACAARLVAKYDAEKPVRSLRYVFIDPADARSHLHELWLREIEVWAIVDGKEVRLDEDYHPTPTPPSWVRDVQARGDQ